MIHEADIKIESKNGVIQSATSSLWKGDSSLHNGGAEQADISVVGQNGVKVNLDAKLKIATTRTCECKPTNLNCLTPKEWMKCQLGVWEFNYEKRDIRDKKKHPATYPISLARRCIELFSHQGELVVDPFMGSGTTLVAARDTARNAVGFDIHPDYMVLAQERLNQESLFTQTQQLSILDDARHIPHYLNEESITCVVTSPPYANLLNRQRKNKSRRGEERKNDQYQKIEQYSQRPEDLGTLDLASYSEAIAEIFSGILPLMKKKGHCVINVPDMWWENERITIHIAVVNALRSVGYELRNTIIWNRLNVVNNVGIFGWPSNYITMGTTFEYLLDFWRPENFVVPDVHPVLVEDHINRTEDTDSPVFTEENEFETETVSIDDQINQLHDTEPPSSSPKSKGKSRNPRKRKTSQASSPGENILDQLNEDPASPTIPGLP